MFQAEGNQRGTCIRENQGIELRGLQDPGSSQSKTSIQCQCYSRSLLNYEVPRKYSPRIILSWLLNNGFIKITKNDGAHCSPILSPVLCRVQHGHVFRGSNKKKSKENNAGTLDNRVKGLNILFWLTSNEPETPVCGSVSSVTLKNEGRGGNFLQVTSIRLSKNLRASLGKGCHIQGKRGGQKWVLSLFAVNQSFRSCCMQCQMQDAVESMLKTLKLILGLTQLS